MQGTFEKSLQKEKITHGSIEELREPLRILLTEFREEFDKRAYDFIIGDDASGRIPALIIGGIAKAVAKEHGKQPPQIVFFAGSRGLANEEKREEKIQTIATHLTKRLEENQLPPRVLLVTEYIDTGRGVLPLTEAFRRTGIEYDVASIIIGNSVENLRNRLHMKPTERFVYSSQSASLPKVYSDTQASGVVKNPIETYSRRLPSRAGHRTKLHEIRKDASLLVKQLLDYYNHGPKTLDEIYAEQQAIRRSIIPDEVVLALDPFDLEKELKKRGKERVLNKWIATQKVRRNNDGYEKYFLFTDEREKKINSKLLVLGL